MPSSRWIEATTKENMPQKKGGMRRIAAKHREPDADDRGGPSDNDADDPRPPMKKKKGGIIAQMNSPVSY
jgi:hypothetical protein